MSAVIDAIETKKSGGELSDNLIQDVVAGYTVGDVPDYQMASLLMAIFIQGMSYEETLALTRAMAESGETYAFPECVDKHSTGGVGDKVSLTALPIVAACGAPVAKLSGRGLGATGGTVDKLESIPGFSCHLSEEQFRDQVEEIGLAIVEAGDLAPADREIYALRDTTGTVDSLPLIGSSIVSKKVATGAGHLLYDVKRGSGAFMKTTEEARELADLLVRLSEDLGIDASAMPSKSARASSFSRTRPSLKTSRTRSTTSPPFSSNSRVFRTPSMLWRARSPQAQPTRSSASSSAPRAATQRPSKTSPSRPG
jgi:thymidine phosphorylase